jgi:hypothetical protein
MRQKPLRRLLVLLFLIILLGVAYALNRLTANWHYVLPVETGKIAYAATFDDFIDDWDLSEGRLNSQIENSTLRLAADDAEKIFFSVTKQYWGNFDFSVQTGAMDGPLNNGYGLIFRFQNKGNGSPSDDDFYLFLVSSDGYYQVTRSIDGTQEELSNWIPSPLVNQGIGVTNTVRVVAVGNRFQFYINDQLVQVCIPDNPEGISTYNEFKGGCIEGQMMDVLVDSSIPNGQIGVVIQTLDEPGVIVNFDNVMIVGPQPINE